MKVNSNTDLKLTVCWVYTHWNIMYMSRRFGGKCWHLHRGDCV